MGVPRKFKRLDANHNNKNLISSFPIQSVHSIAAGDIVWMKYDDDIQVPVLVRDVTKVGFGGNYHLQT